MTNQQAISHLENMKWLKGYDNTSVNGVPLVDIIDDIIALLREQEKTKVVFRQCDGSVESECGNCGLYLDKTYSVCPKCGKELDWNG